MRRIKKPVFFIVVGLIAAFTVLCFTGIKTKNGDYTNTYIKNTKDIRWGIDIQGGVDVTFAAPDDVNPTKAQLEAAKEKIQQRMVNQNITDYESYLDEKNKRIIVRFPWKSGETDFNPEQAVKELGETAFMTFREGYDVDSAGQMQGVTKDTIILQGEDVKLASAGYNQDTKQYVVSLELNSSGKDKFGEATARLAKTNGQISIWMDDLNISHANVNEAIPNGKAEISGSFTADEAKKLASQINSGALPFELETKGLNIISPTDGESAKNSMLLAGVIAFGLIAIMMVFLYRLPGCVAIISLFGQVIGTVAALTGFFGIYESFTLTIPGIAGIILAVGMGVDANIITAERIKEELRKGKSLDGSIQIGFSKAFSAIFDGNITVVLIALILMGSFGPPDSIPTKALSWLFFAFGPSTAGTIYSFGFTLIVGVILNFLFGVFCSRLMISSLSKFKIFRNPKLYGGVKNEENL